MFKSILAVSEGGPDGAMSFKLAARVAAIFDGTVDALHLPVGPAGGMAGGLAMSGEAMPLIMNLDDERLEERSKESERAYKEIVAPIGGATYTAAKTATLDTLVAMGRCADLLVLGRPGADPGRIADGHSEAADRDQLAPSVTSGDAAVAAAVERAEEVFNRLCFPRQRQESIRQIAA